MKLKLQDKDLERILLEWAEAKFPGMFDEVKFDGYYIDTSYSTIRKVTFSRKEIEEAE